MDEIAIPDHMLTDIERFPLSLTPRQVEYVDDVVNRLGDDSIGVVHRDESGGISIYAQNGVFVSDLIRIDQWPQGEAVDEPNVDEVLVERKFNNLSRIGGYAATAAFLVSSFYLAKILWNNPTPLELVHEAFSYEGIAAQLGFFVSGAAALVGLYHADWKTPEEKSFQVQVSRTRAHNDFTARQAMGSVQLYPLDHTEVEQQYDTGPLEKVPLHNRIHEVAPSERLLKLKLYLGGAQFGCCTEEIPVEDSDVKVFSAIPYKSARVAC
tara:strand:+ start:1967 stop:2767 length:801 start_codon:yes stop_codon:yes gene_type:complete